MIKLGIVDFDTSHVVQFTKRMNHINIEQDQWVDGAQIVCGFKGTSMICDQARIDQYEKEMREMGVEVVEKPEDMIGKVDGVLIESVDGSVHLERATPFLKKKLPIYIDKPFATSLKDAKKMVEMAKKANVPIMSSSSLRFAVELVQAKNDPAVGKVVGANCYSPAPLHVRNPGLYHYGIHAVEPLFALMGPGLQVVWCVKQEGAEVVIGLWQDGRLGTIRGTRAGAHAYGFTVWGDKGVKQSSINPGLIYRELCKQIVTMFTTGKAPVDIQETLEIMAFIDAAMCSAKGNGKAVPIKI
ncbi:MAG: Gfo/Idh/MocA family oxidoreductase [Planctomycetota bacterium]